MGAVTVEPTVDGAALHDDGSPDAVATLGPIVHTTRNPITWLLARLIELYRLTAPNRAPRCRFHPSCSTYSRDALLVHGPVRGLWLSARRLLRCHPWNPGGVDHVPPKATR